jgi:hypothetical protein
MKPMEIAEIRLLPPMAIGRLGGAIDPMDNYDVVVPDDQRLGWRKIRPATTLHVNVSTGEIERSSVPDKLVFKDAHGLIRPVSPFLELWVRFEGESDLVPLTIEHLKERQVEASSLRWTVHVANRKAMRRTSDVSDVIECRITDIVDHDRRALEGKCKNFIEGAVIPLGFAQYIKPTDAFPQIRFRFTPAFGHVYGPEGAHGPFQAAVYRKDGPWVDWKDTGSPLSTNPGQIYYGGRDSKSKGYLDDSCDGIVDVELETNGKLVSSYARIMAGPPTFAPDSSAIRRILDELDMALNGPEASKGTNADVQAIVRRAFESIRLMNTTLMNGNPVTARGNNMPSQDAGSYNRYFAPIMNPVTVDNNAVEAIHEHVFGALEASTPPWFAETFRRFDEIGDLTDAGRKRMPAMMRGADGMYLALTRRQLDTIRKAAGLESLEKSATDKAPEK